MGIILSSTAALELLLQLATQLAAAGLLFSKHQPNPSAASIHDLHSFTAKKNKVQVFFYRYRISLDFCAKKVKFFGFVFCIDFCAQGWLHFFLMEFFSRVQDLLSDFYWFLYRKRRRRKLGLFINFFQSREFCFVLFCWRRRRITDQEKRICRSRLNSGHGTIFSVQFSNFWNSNPLIEWIQNNCTWQNSLNAFIIIIMFQLCFVLFCFVLWNLWFFLGHQNLNKTQFQCFFWVHLFCFAMRFLVSKIHIF